MQTKERALAMTMFHRSWLSRDGGFRISSLWLSCKLYCERSFLLKVLWKALWKEALNHRALLAKISFHNSMSSRTLRSALLYRNVYRFGSVPTVEACL